MQGQKGDIYFPLGSQLRLLEKKKVVVEVGAFTQRLLHAGSRYTH